MYRHRVGRYRARDHVRCDRVLPCDHVHGDVSPRLSHTSAFVLGSTHPPFPACLARRAMRQWSRPSPAHQLAPPPVIRRRPLRFDDVSPRRPPWSPWPSSGTAPPPPCHTSSSASSSAQSGDPRDRPSRPGPWTRRLPRPSRPVALFAETGLLLFLALSRPRPQRRDHADDAREVTIVDDVVPIVRLLLVLVASKKYAPEASSRQSTHPGRRLDPGRQLEG